MFIVIRHPVRRSLYFRGRVGHGYAQPGGAEHGQVVGAVAKGHGLLHFHAQMAAQRLQRRALVGGSPVQFNIVPDRTCHRKFRKQRGQQTQLSGALLHVGKIHLELLYARTGVLHIAAQAFHRRAQTHQQVQDPLVGHKFHRPFIKAPVHIAPVILIAVVEQPVFLHIVNDPQSHLQRNILPEDRAVLPCVIYIGSVHRNAPAQEGQGLQRLRQARVNAPGGRNDDHPLLCRGCQRRHILRRDILFPIQQGPVQVKSDQFVSHVFTPFLFLLKRKAPSLASVFWYYPGIEITSLGVYNVSDKTAL